MDVGIRKLCVIARICIFLDVDPTCFQAIVDCLNELTISSKDSPPSPPSVDDEHKLLINYQLELFGLVPECSLPDSNIIKDVEDCVMLHQWLKEDGQDGEFSLLFRGTRDGQQTKAFHSKCDNKGCTLNVIKTMCGKVFGGYSNTAWSSTCGYKEATKAFLFVLPGGNNDFSTKNKLKNENDDHAIFCGDTYGPVFGGGNAIKVDGSNRVHIFSGRSYDQGLLPNGSYTIEEIEVFLVTKSSTPIKNSYSKRIPTKDAFEDVEEVIRFTMT